MNLSFLATIVFATLVLAGTFLANLVVLVFTNSQWHASGVVLSIMAAAASYWAQSQFTVAGLMRDDNAAAVSIQAMHLASTIDRTEGCGNAFQFVAIALLVGALACFWLGLR